MEGRPYLTPMWLMLALLVVICIFEFSYFVRNPVPLFEFGYGILFRPSVVLVETVLYFIIRNRFTGAAQKWMWVHICCLMLAFIALGAIFLVIDLLWTNDSVAAAEASDRIRLNIYWSLLVIGHIAFAMVLIKSFKADKST